MPAPEARLMGRPASRRLLWLAAVLLAAASMGLHAAHEADVKLLSDVASRVDAGRALSDSERVIAYVNFAVRNIRVQSYEQVHPWPVRLYYRFNPMHPGPGDVLRWGTDYRGPCGSCSRVVHAMLGSRGIPNRIMLLRGENGQSIHTVLEVLVDGRWIVADPSSGIVFHRRDGDLASREDLARDHALMYAQVDTVKAYDPKYDYDSTTLFNWHKIPVVLPAVRFLLVLALGEPRVAAINRPEIWIWPREGAALLCIAGSIAFALAATRRRRPAPAAGRSG